MEVIVVDDRSDDGTGDVARAAANGDSRLHIVEGVEPPTWLGWQSHGLVFVPQKREQGAWLVFVDADVRLHQRQCKRLSKLRKKIIGDVKSVWNLDC